jgi:hypothetical protein
VQTGTGGALPVANVTLAQGEIQGEVQGQGEGAAVGESTATGDEGAVLGEETAADKAGIMQMAKNNWLLILLIGGTVIIATALIMNIYAKAKKKIR